MMKRTLNIGVMCLIVFLCFACESEDPENTDLSDMNGGSPSDTNGGDNGGEEGGNEGGDTSILVVDATPTSDAYERDMCMPNADDYPGDTWGECISDEGRYELAGDNTPSSAARVAAFDEIAALLWRSEDVTVQNLVDAELIYGEDGGVGSRVARRYDAHVSKPEGADCKADDAATQWPEYCVGPAQIEPLIIDSFAEAIAGNDVTANIANVRSGLVWFYYLSVYKEAYSCASKAQDCDSHWAYGNGGKQLDEDPLGLAGLIKTQSTLAYEALFNANLAVRCWRAEDATEVSENPDLHQKVLAQVDRALDYAYSLVLIGELNRWSTGSNRVKVFAEQTLIVLGPTIARAASERGSSYTFGDVSTWQSLSNDKVSELIEALSEAFPCP